MIISKERISSVRAMGLDIGDNTIGISISDELFFTAQGIETIRRKNLADDIKRLMFLQREYDVDIFVLGYPKNMNGTEGPRCQVVKNFMDTLKKYFPKTKFVLQDERLSTKEARRQLISADVSRKKRKKVIDKMAAVIILQSYLDSLSC